jgi:hypothetical protein
MKPEDTILISAVEDLRNTINRLIEAKENLLAEETKQVSALVFSVGQMTEMLEGIKRRANL